MIYPLITNFRKNANFDKKCKRLERRLGWIPILFDFKNILNYSTTSLNPVLHGKIAPFSAGLLYKLNGLLLYNSAILV